MKNLELELTKSGFVYEGRDDYESADGGLPTTETRLVNKDGEYIGDWAENNGFTKEEVTDNRGRKWTTFIDGEWKIIHRSFGEKSISGEVLTAENLKTFRFYFIGK